MLKALELETAKVYLALVSTNVEKVGSTYTPEGPAMGDPSITAKEMGSIPAFAGSVAMSCSRSRLTMTSHQRVSLLQVLDVLRVLRQCA